jgi:putative endonuclease
MKYHTKDNINIGKIGENIAAKYLKSKGFRILERNYKIKFGEIDIICISPEKIMVFVEVKTLCFQNNFSPEDHMTFKKINNFKRSAQFYFNNNPICESFRLDLIAITIGEDSKIIKINHYENVY